MCGRYYIEVEESEMNDIVNKVEKSLLGEAMQTGEIYPTNIVPSVSASGLTLMQWGFPRYDGKGIVINARSETITEKRMFAGPFATSRCLLPASYYFEWKPDGSTKIKHRMFQSGSEMLYLAGIAKNYGAGAPLKFVILTRPAVQGISYVHDRMPVILPSYMHDAWLYGEIHDAEAAMRDAETRIEAVPA